MPLTTTPATAFDPPSDGYGYRSEFSPPRSTTIPASPSLGAAVRPATGVEPIGPGIPSGGNTLPLHVVPPEPQGPTFPSFYSWDYWFGPIPWDRSIELGINGSKGPSSSFNIRAGGYVKRKTDWNKLDVQLVYNQTDSDGVASQNNAQLDARHDWLLGKSPWTLFAATSLLYDEFQAFDLRLAANGGVGYQFIDRPGHSLIGRFGAGTSREFGGPDDRWVPEALLGGEYNLTLCEGQKFYAKADYFPDWGDFSSYRVVADVGYEIVINSERDLSLKLSAIDRYDSTPNGVDPNLLTYSVLLLWKL